VIISNKLFGRRVVTAVCVVHQFAAAVLLVHSSIISTALFLLAAHSSVVENSSVLSTPAVLAARWLAIVQQLVAVFNSSMITNSVRNVTGELVCLLCM